jgi:hypothetical protein
MTSIKQLMAALVGVKQEQINTHLVYTNPAVSALTSALKEISVEDGVANGINGSVSWEKKMEETLASFIEQLPVPSKAGKKDKRGDEPLTVILTGSTGSLGSYLPDTLISSPRVFKATA